MRGRRSNLAGRKFGNLTVLDNWRRGDTGDIVWLCRCNCGREVWKRADNLTRGQIKSCGNDHQFGNHARSSPAA